jgi:hypothetical protein
MLDLSETRWKGVYNGMPKYAGLISSIEKFDADFFGYAPEWSNSMDPQCRMLLEHAYEAVMDAGVFYSVFKLGYDFSSSFLPVGSQKLKSPVIDIHTYLMTFVYSLSFIARWVFKK